MKNNFRTMFIVICALVLPSMTFAKVEVPSIFGDNMILQRELLVPIWGLKPLEASRTERRLTIKGSNTITFEGVLVGEVWLCSGQSNMDDKFNPQKKRYIEPEYFKMDLSRFRFSSRNGWNEITPATQRSVSRVSFYFGIELYKELDIPIGLIFRSNSATPIQAWMPKEASEVIRKKLGIPADWKDAQRIRNPAVQFDDKIAPIVPFAFRGAIWYQGERNAKAQTGWEYRDLFPSISRPGVNCGQLVQERNCVTSPFITYRCQPKILRLMRSGPG